MAKNKEPKVDEVGVIESHLQLDSLELKGLRWKAKFTVETTLPRTYHKYRVILELDEDPYVERIEAIEINFNDSLFKTDPKSVKAHEKQLQDLKDDLERLRGDCEKIEFFATVEELKYKNSDTQIAIRIPDDVIEPINRQKTRLNIYKVSLLPNQQ